MMSLAFESGILIVKLPSGLVSVPLLDFFSSMLAPISGEPLSSVTFPDTTRCCAFTMDPIRMERNKHKTLCIAGSLVRRTTYIEVTGFSTQLPRLKALYQLELKTRFVVILRPQRLLKMANG